MKYRMIVLTLFMAASAGHAELVQQFKNPAFSGVGYSSHVLTIDSIEKSRRDAIENDKKATAAKIEADLLNTPLNRFMSLFQSQVYAQLSTQLSNNLFQNKCAAADGSAQSARAASARSMRARAPRRGGAIAVRHSCTACRPMQCRATAGRPQVRA